MESYDSLVKALRSDAASQYTRDAAAAIEALGTLLVEADKKQAYQHDRICELTAENEELQAENETLHQHIADLNEAFRAESKRRQELEPKRGEWVEAETAWRCSICEAESPHTYPICPYCGSIMRTSLYDSEK